MPNILPSNNNSDHVLLASMGEMKLSHDSFLKFSNRRAFRGCWGQILSLNFEILTSKNDHQLWKDIFFYLNIIFCFLDCTLPFRVGIFTDGVMTAAGAALNDAGIAAAFAAMLPGRGVCLDYKQI